ncbi:MAG: hypothetical protein JWQ89_3912 [Devosia sp.]|uniref:hypothetical protein n=1 Tax=Devosia sp. TaxID=1871048 RepID=UPI002618B8D2|nr:hypothetical protein [Devosia sp.]MDB5542185.1 hypothetical protein [Devosia sp.]
MLSVKNSRAVIGGPSLSLGSGAHNRLGLDPVEPVADYLDAPAGPEVSLSAALTDTVADTISVMHPLESVASYFEEKANSNSLLKGISVQIHDFLKELTVVL